MSEPFTALSWGGGQQSTAILIASTLGLTINGYTFPKLDLAVFADTGSESEGTNESIERVAAWAVARGTRCVVVEATQLKRGKERGLNSLGDLVVARMTGDPRAPKSTPQLPLFTKNPDGTNGKTRKDCTWDMKSIPLDRAVRDAARDVGKRNHVTQLIGFGIEEVHRMRTNPHAKEGWRYEFPLIRARMGRGDTTALCQEHLGFTPPPSACVFCPYRGIAGWKALGPADFEEVVRVDAAIRDSRNAGLDGECFLSDRRVPVEQAIEADDRQPMLPFGGRCDSGSCWT